MADMYKSDGVANLRADESTKAGSMTDPPSAGGKDCGGKENLRADLNVKTAPTTGSPTGSANHLPSGVQSFNGEAV